MSTASTVRARVRAELIDEIKATARRQLAVEGAAALSLRAVAREVGMVSSAVYRYFPSRDDLLTALIIDAYNAVGERAEQADAAVRRNDFRGRWIAVGEGIRGWAIENVQEYGLVYGTPIPEYRAPEETVGPATRPTTVLVKIMHDAVAAGACNPPREPVPRAVRADLASARAFFSQGAPADVVRAVDDDLIVRGIMVWTHLFGSITFELFGHRVGAVSDHDAFFHMEMQRLANVIGVP